MTDELTRARAALRLLDASVLEGLRQQGVARSGGLHMPSMSHWGRVPRDVLIEIQKIVRFASATDEEDAAPTAKDGDHDRRFEAGVPASSLRVEDESPG